MIVVNILIVLKSLFLAAFVFILGYIAFIMWSFRHTVPFVPTPKRVIRQMIELADIKANEKICDLGSGTGRIILAVAQKHKKSLVVGIEKSPTLRLVSRLILFFHPFIKGRISIVNRDFFNADLSQFDVILCFLTPEGLRILAPKFQALKSGSRIISYMFPLEEHLNYSETAEHLSVKDSIYIYKKL